jgi:phasin family protein
MTLKTRNEDQAAAAAVMAATPATSASKLATTSMEAAASAGRATAEAATAAVDRAASSARNGIDQAAAGVEQTQMRMQQGMEKAMRTAEEIVAFGQGNVAAFVRSGQIWAAGLQDLGKQVAATAQGQIADTVTALKAIAGAKSVKDAIELQAALARTAIEKTFAESGRITETSLKLTEQALAPVAARVSLAVEKFGRA